MQGLVKKHYRIVLLTCGGYKIECAKGAQGGNSDQLANWEYKVLNTAGRYTGPQGWLICW